MAPCDSAERLNACSELKLEHARVTGKTSSIMPMMDEISRSIVYAESYCQIWCLAFSSSGDLIVLRYFNTVSEFDPGHDLGQIIEAT